MTVKRFLALGFALISLLSCGGGGGSSPNPEVAGPTAAPAGFHAVLNFSEISLTWSSAIPSGMESLRIYRAAYEANNTPGNYNRIAEVPITALSFTDTQLQELTKYNYRMCYVKNNLEGPFAYTEDRQVGLLPPIQLNISAGTNSATLTWKNLSTHATTILVNRLFLDGAQGGQWTQIASISATSTTFTDSNIASGLYVYSLSCSDGLYPAIGPEVSTWVLDSENPLHLSSQIISSPGIGNRWWERTPSGDWVVLDELGTIYIPNSQQSWKKFSLSTPITGYANPGLRLDSSGKPHIMYYTRTGSDADPMIITHAWYDGSNWKSEEVTRRTLRLISGISIMGFDVTSSGVVHAFWQLGDGLSGNHIEYGTNETGTWSLSSITSSLIDFNSSSVFLVTIKTAVDGTIYLCVPVTSSGVGFQLLILNRQPSQSWKEELTPLPPGTIDAFDPVLLLPVNIAGYDLIYYQNESNNLLTDVMCLSKRNNLWGQPELIIARGFSGYRPRLWGAITKDGSRTAVGVVIPAPGHLSDNLDSSHLVFTRDSPNTWTKTTLTNSGQSERYQNYSLGFDSSNRFYGLYINTLALFLEK